jgi:hypothetical protein
VSNWLSEKSGLPQETRNYVLAITGLSVEHWKEAARGLQSFKLAKRMPCRDHEAFVEAGEALDESNTEERAKVKTAPSGQVAPRIPAPSVASDRLRKAAKIRKDERLGSTRGRNSSARQALGQGRAKAKDPDAG